MAEKYLWESSIFRNVHAAIFLKGFPAYEGYFFKKIFAEVLINKPFLWDSIELKKSLQGTLKV